jgi:hypothetical protein
MDDLDAQERAGSGSGDEVLSAGFLPRAGAARGSSGFESGGALDACAPGGPLAGLADAATRDGRLSGLGDDDELIGAPDPGLAGTSGFTVMVSPLAGQDCDHRHQEAAYQPSRKLRHLVWARNPTCCAPGCLRPAARCDLDHTVPYDQGGRTCECDLAPLCRHHHRCKQAEGWRLEQPSPGIMRWTAPAGRRYHLRP